MHTHTHVYICLSIYTGNCDKVQVLVIPLRVSLPPTVPTDAVNPKDTSSALFPSVARHYVYNMYIYSVHILSLNPRFVYLFCIYIIPKP